MRYYVECDRTGRITEFWGVPENARYDRGVPVQREPDPDNDWMNCSKLEPRPTMDVVIENGVIYGIPKGAVLTLADQSFTVEDGEAEISGYCGKVLIECWPYFDMEVMVCEDRIQADS